MLLSTNDTDLLILASNFVENRSLQDEELSSFFNSIMCEPLEEHKEKYAQFFTPVDVSLYTSLSLLDNFEINKHIVFDPCVGMGSLLLSCAYVLAKKHNLKDTSLLEKLHGSEISNETRLLCIDNIYNTLKPYLPNTSEKTAKNILAKNIISGDFLSVNIPENSFLIANPPYKEDKSAKIKNIWIAFAQKITESPNIEAFSLIVPVSICSADRTLTIRKNILKNYNNITSFHHEIRPRPLFLKVEQRITILTCKKNGHKQYKTTGFLTHSAKSRKNLWLNKYTSLNLSEISNVFPKIYPEDYDFYQLHKEHTNTPIDPLEETNDIWIRTTGRYKLLCQFDKPIAITSKWKKINTSIPLTKAIFKSFNNGQALKWWKMFGDGRDISLTKFIKHFNFYHE